jgi:hypothetical protein
MSDIDEIKKYLDSIGKDPIHVKEGAILTESVLHEEDAAEVAVELEELRDQMRMLVDEAMSIIPRDSATYERARSYWYPHILQALGGENEYMGSSMHSIQDSIDELAEEGAPYDQDGEDY